MRCIFCKQPSSSSRSVEHVIPESLGNTRMILPSGVVCDACNNYFGRSIEKAFLDSSVVRKLRFDQALANKRGRVPRLDTSLALGGRAQLSHPVGGPAVVWFDRRTDALRVLNGTSRLLLGDTVTTPAASVLSRFVGKIALEYLAMQLTAHTGLDWLVDNPELDPLRMHVRHGATPDWCVSTRRLYNANDGWEEGGHLVQRVWEAIAFETEDGTPHFALALFGLEFVIGLTLPELTSYRRWLLANGGNSPLFSGHYTTDWRTRRGMKPPPQRAFIGVS